VSEVYAVIGGSGLYSLDQSFRIESSQKPNTPYGEVSAELTIGELM
jgi:purine nucleoside phosphorylase